MDTPKLLTRTFATLLFPPQGMIPKERPHDIRGADTLARATDKPLRHPLAAGPGVAAVSEGVEHHRCAIGATSVLAARDVRRHAGIDRRPGAAVAATPIPGPRQHVGKRVAGEPRRAA